MLAIYPSGVKSIVHYGTRPEMKASQWKNHVELRISGHAYLPEFDAPVGSRNRTQFHLRFAFLPKEAPGYENEPVNPYAEQIMQQFIGPAILRDKTKTQKAADTSGLLAEVPTPIRGTAGIVIMRGMGGGDDDSKAPLGAEIMGSLYIGNLDDGVGSSLADLVKFSQKMLTPDQMMARILDWLEEMNRFQLADSQLLLQPLQNMASSLSVPGVYPGREFLPGELSLAYKFLGCCSNHKCGKPSPYDIGTLSVKPAIVCSGCKSVAYCNEVCQEGAKSYHLCERLSNTRVRNLLVEPMCSMCGVVGTLNAPLRFCARCKQVKYCGVECQKKSWKAGHNLVCKKGEDKAEKEEKGEKEGKTEKEDKTKTAGKGKKN